MQKSHYKSSVIPRLLAAIDIYRSLGVIPQVRTDVARKLLSMLKTNPFPRVRVAAAEVLWLLTEHKDLLIVDWGRDKDEVADRLLSIEGEMTAKRN